MIKTIWVKVHVVAKVYNECFTIITDCKMEYNVVRSSFCILIESEVEFGDNPTSAYIALSFPSTRLTTKQCC